MNRRMIVRVLAMMMIMEALLLLLPLCVGLYYKENVMPFAVTSVALAVCGAALFFIFKPRYQHIYAREGFIIVTLSWVVLSLFGAVPFTLSGDIPNYLNAVFETVSGFTTTGASILQNVEVLTRSGLFWRSFTHWIGGMGVLVFIMAVLPLSKGGGDIFLMRAESPGPDVGKLVPKSRRTARILYGLYIGLTALELLLLLLGNMPLFDSLTVTFGTAGTGGFGISNASIGKYSVYCQTVVSVFMTLFGINFSLYYLILAGRIKDALKSEELRVYLGIMFSAAIAVTINVRSMFPSLYSTFHHSFFQVSSVMTTTGFSTTDFNMWPDFSRSILLMIMCVGACAGSTGGGIKIQRLIILFKGAKKEIKKVARPRSVSVVISDGKKIDDVVLRSTYAYFIIYVMMVIVSFVIVLLDGEDMLSSFSGVIATINNIGPGFGICGAAGNYSSFGAVSKLVFIADMLMGRLELFPIVITITSFARRRRKKA